MWDTVNVTPYAVGSTWGRDKNGVHEWIVAVKAAFDIREEGHLDLAAEQADPLLIPEYNGEDGVSSLRYDADLVALKPTTDIVLNGTAYAPRGRFSTDFTVSMRVGPVQKTLRVRGNRRWEGGRMGIGPSAVEPVTEVPIVYERAYGGYDRKDPDPRNQRLDTRNPVGCGVAADVSHRVGQMIPNFEYPDGRIEVDGPAGFGAIDSFWSPRRELTGTYDDAWKRRQYPLLPVDWDPRSLLCSPQDQLPQSHLRGGELVELHNLTPDGQLRFALPKVYLHFRTRLDKGRSVEHDGKLASVIIEPDRMRVMMVWQASLPVPTDVDYLDETIVTEKARIR
jgi:hypothetical protein